MKWVAFLTGLTFDGLVTGAAFRHDWITVGMYAPSCIIWLWAEFTAVKRERNHV